MKAATRTKTAETSGRGVALARRTDLFVIIDGDRPLDGGARYSLDGVDLVSFGRGVGCGTRHELGDQTQLSIPLQNDHVSKAHAALRRVSEGWILADEGSKNGTFLNNRRITGVVPARPGDLIQIGNVFCVIRVSPVPGDVEVSGDLAGAAEIAAASFSGCPTLVPFLAARMARLRMIVATREPIVIVGETGTGKEILARAIHADSGRPGRFVPVNCAELSPTIIEGQLFGYVKGAYSGAGGGDPGYIASADGGTLFLDEIPEGEVVPLGRSRSQPVDVRFLSATQRHLRTLVDAGGFRSDLYARLEYFVAEVPPLRERREDMGLLVEVILRRRGAQESQCLTLLPTTVMRMLTHAWPQNIRQLDKGLGRALQFSRGGVLDERALFQDGEAETQNQPAEGPLSEADERERGELISLLERYDGNVSAVSRELKKHKATIYDELDRLDVNPKQFRRRRAR
jgi:transcriptional regulator with PAS, ATPase and Fis domain